MIIWINGAFGSGKTTVAHELRRRVPGALLFDPEHIGFFLRQQAPSVFPEKDFQDIPLWRSFTRQILTTISGRHPGVLIVPMTLVNPQYYHEIITFLQEGGVEVEHYILSATKKTLLKRLRLRSLRGLGQESFAVQNIDRCLHSFDHLITCTRIETDQLTIDQVVQEIARRSNLPLRKERRRPWRKRLDRLAVLLRHIR